MARFAEHRIGWWTAAAAGLALLAACAEREVILEGERFSVRAPLSDSLREEGKPAPQGTVDGLVREARPISLPAAQANADWGQRGGNARHSIGHVALSTAPQLAWAVNIGQGSSKRLRLAAAPVVSGGRVFALDAAGTVSAVSTSGALIWQSSIVPPDRRGPAVSGGGLAAEGGRIYIASAYGEVVALEAASGQVAWRQKIDAPIQGAPAVADGVVYVSGRDGGAWAIDAKNGLVEWHVIGTPGMLGYLGSAAPTVADRSVIFPSGAGDLMSVLKIGGGTKIWQESIAGRRLGRAYANNQDVTGDAALVGGTLYTGTGAGRTVAVDAGSGTRIWSAGEGALGPLSVTGGSVFLVNDEARLVRLDAASGETIWEIEMPYYDAAKVKKRKAITAHFGPVVAGGRVWVASSDGWLRGFDPVNANLVHSAEIPGGAATQPAVAGRTLYVVSNNGQLLAFR